MIPTATPITPICGVLRPRGDRDRYVTEHCSDPALRRELLEMLASPAPLSEIATAGALGPGDPLGPYLIERLLGRGGMGVVYRARDTRLARTVAIKVLPPELSADAARRDRFDREARAIAALDHPHICTLYDISRDEGIDFLLMQKPAVFTNLLRRFLESCGPLIRAGIVQRELAS